MVCVVSLSLQAENWPMWRGAEGSGVTTERNPFSVICDGVAGYGGVPGSNRRAIILGEVRIGYLDRVIATSSRSPSPDLTIIVRKCT